MSKISKLYLLAILLLLGLIGLGTELPGGFQVLVVPICIIIGLYGIVLSGDFPVKDKNRNE